MEQPANNEPRILIVEPDAKVRSQLLRFVVKGFEGSSVQSTSGTLDDVLGEHTRLQSFDVLLVGCDFATDGTAVPISVAYKKDTPRDGSAPLHPDTVSGGFRRPCATAITVTRVASAMNTTAYGKRSSRARRTLRE